VLTVPLVLSLGVGATQNQDRPEEKVAGRTGAEGDPNQPLGVEGEDCAGDQPQEGGGRWHKSNKQHQAGGGRPLAVTVPSAAGALAGPLPLVKVSDAFGIVTLASICPVATVLLLALALSFHVPSPWADARGPSRKLHCVRVP
jgi:hypothetical protein